MTMHTTYDPTVNAAYLYLREIEPGGAVRTVEVEEAPGIMLDFDREGRLIGIEVLDARERLPAEVIAAAEILTDDKPKKRRGR